MTQNPPLRIVIACIACVSCLCATPATAFELRYELQPGQNLSGPYQSYEGVWRLDGGLPLLDFDGDGAAELVVKSTSISNPIQVHHPLGIVAWSYTLQASSVCPSCTGVFDSGLVGFAQLDPTPGREALFSWTGVDHRGLAFVSTTSGDVLWSQELSFSSMALADFDGDGLDEMLLMGTGQDQQGEQVWGTQPNAAVEQGSVGGPMPAVAFPNPTRLNSLIRFEAPSAGRVMLTLHDVGGRHVRRIASGLLGAGPNEIRWDGRSDSGAMVPPGTYYCDIEFPGGRSFAKVTVVR